MARSRSIVLNNILTALQADRLNIQQVAKKAEVEWQTAKNYLEELEKLGIVSSTVEGREKVFAFITQSNVSFDENTILGIPLTEDQKNKTLEIAAALKSAWQKKTSKVLLNTCLAKMVVEVIKVKKVNVPFGWYLYGPCPALKFRAENIPSSDKLVDADILKIVNEYEPIDSASEIRRHFYRKYSQTQYLRALDIMNKLQYGVDSNSADLLRLDLESFIFGLSSNEETIEIIGYANAVYSFMLKILRHRSLAFINENRLVLQQVFNALWTIIGTYNYYSTLTQEGVYTPDQIKSYYAIQSHSVMQTADPFIFELKDLANSD